MAYLPDIRTFGLSGPGDDARYSQACLTGVHKVRRVHLPSQGLDVLQNGHLNLKEPTDIWSRVSLKLQQSH